MLLNSIPMLGFLIGKCWILCAIVNDITDNLACLNAIKTTSSRHENENAIACFRNVVQEYLTVNELSLNI